MVSASSTEDGMAGHHPDLNKVRWKWIICFQEVGKDRTTVLKSTEQLLR